jgi:hypothetical protein|tara:strand:+ start:10726 stop:10920 length:195 start_codon:yes stop_codon:yes gene_type:complete
MKIFLTTDLINEILNYLAERPFKEANPLISKVMQEVKMNEDQNKNQTELNLTKNEDNDEGGTGE